MRTLTWSAPCGADSVTGGPKVVRAGGSDTRTAVTASTRMAVTISMPTLRRTARTRWPGTAAPMTCRSASRAAASMTATRATLTSKKTP